VLLSSDEESESRKNKRAAIEPLGLPNPPSCCPANFNSRSNGVPATITSSKTADEGNKHANNNIII